MGAQGAREGGAGAGKGGCARAGRKMAAGERGEGMGHGRRADRGSRGLPRGGMQEQRRRVGRDGGAGEPAATRSPPSSDARPARAPRRGGPCATLGRSGGSRGGGQGRGGGGRAPRRTASPAGHSPRRAPARGGSRGGREASSAVPRSLCATLPCCSSSLPSPEACWRRRVAGGGRRRCRGGREGGERKWEEEEGGRKG